ncbi:MAG: hypothetical protein RLZZ117_2849 [Cyanobacteriota bacterium]|jgi:hypothetical protein
MGELSDRFGELMARLANSDAELFRAIGEQNATVRQLVDDLAPVAERASAAPALLPPRALPEASAQAALLAPDDCEIPALKARFRKVADARAWLESQIGPATKTPTWAVIAQTCRTGSWPVSARRRVAAPAPLTPADLEERLTALEQRLTSHLDQRFRRLEDLLSLLVSAMEAHP